MDNRPWTTDNGPRTKKNDAPHGPLATEARVERCINLDRIAAGKSLAASPVQSQVAEKTAQDAAAGSVGSGSAGCVRAGIGVGRDFCIGRGGRVPNGTPASLIGGTFTLGSARMGADSSPIVRLVGRFVRARAGSSAPPADRPARKAPGHCWRRPGQPVARSRAAGLPGLPACPDQRDRQAVWARGPGHPAASRAGCGLIRLKRRSAAAWQRRLAWAGAIPVALPSPLRPRQAGGALVPHRQRTETP